MNQANLDRVIAFLLDFTMVKEIHSEDTIFEALGIDMSTDDFLEDAEDEFGVALDGMLDEVTTVADLVNALRKEAGFSPLSTSDLPAYDETENTYVRPVSSNLVGHRLLEILTWKL